MIVVPDSHRAMGVLIEEGLRWSELIDERLADNECPHGALPTDPSMPDGCTCWQPRESIAVAHNEGAAKRGRRAKTTTRPR